MWTDGSGRRRLCGTLAVQRDSWRWAVALDKTFPVTALVQIQFRAEVYNTFNPTRGAFGTATATQSEERTWPFSLFVKF